MVRGLVVAVVVGMAGVVWGAGEPEVRGGPAVGKRDGRLEVVARLEGAPPAGVVVTKGGRIFLSFPMWGDRHESSLMELGREGKLVAYPPYSSSGEKAPFVSIQGLDLVGEETLYALDAGAGKLYAIDLGANRVGRVYSFSKEVLGEGAYLNDVRVDGRAGVAYVSDSARGGILVVDLKSGRAWRRLEKHVSSRGEEGVVRVVEGEKFSAGGRTDGIALSPDGGTLYYSAFAGREIWGIGTRELRDEGVAEGKLSPWRVAAKGSANDGMGCDGEGRVYSTDYEENAIRVTGPSGGSEMLVQDARLVWPDAVWVAGGWVYVTVNQLNRMAGFHGGRDLREKPFLLVRYPVGRGKDH